MSEKPEMMKRFADGEVKIYRAAKCFEDQRCDRMVVAHPKDVDEDVVIYNESGSRRVARLKRGVDLIAGPSPGVPVSSIGKEWLEPVSAKNEKRLLVIYDNVDSESGADTVP